MANKQPGIAVIGAGVIGGVTLGELLSDSKARKIFLSLMREAMSVAEAMGIISPSAKDEDLRYKKRMGAKLSREWKGIEDHAN